MSPKNHKKIIILNQEKTKGEICSLTGISLPKVSYVVEFNSHRGRILLQFIITTNNVMFEYICIKIKPTFIWIYSLYLYVILIIYKTLKEKKEKKTKKPEKTRYEPIRKEKVSAGPRGLQGFLGLPWFIPT